MTNTENKNYLELKKVLCRCIHDVADLKAVERNNGAVIRLDKVPGEAMHALSETLRPCPGHPHSFHQVDTLQMVLNY